MLHAQFHLDRHHERERELNRKLEVNRQLTDAPARKSLVLSQGLQSKRVLTDPFRRTAHLVQLIASHAKCLLAEGRA